MPVLIRRCTILFSQIAIFLRLSLRGLYFRFLHINPTVIIMNRLHIRVAFSVYKQAAVGVLCIGMFKCVSTGCTFINSTKYFNVL